MVTSSIGLEESHNAKCWKHAEGCFAPKKKESKDVGQFRTISLLNIDGKIFFSILTRQLTQNMLANKYVDTSVQKGGIPGFSVCVEHTSALTQMLHEARINQTDLTVRWLALANAYGSIPHSLIKAALQPRAYSLVHNEVLRQLPLAGFVREDDNIMDTIGKGIVTGCTISVVLFIMGINLIISAAERETRGPMTNVETRLPANRCFMDDMIVTTQTHIQAR